MNAETIMKGFGILVLGGVCVLTLYFIFGPPTDPCEGAKEACICVALLPEDRQGGFNFKGDKEGAIEVNVTGERHKPTDASPEQIAAFVTCVENRGRKIKIENGVRLPLEPVGQVANRWNREQGLHIRLLPSDPPEILPNLAIGPVVDTKVNVLLDWCGPEQAGACVTCKPPDFDESFTEVVVELRTDAKVTRKQMDGTWPVATLDPETNQPTATAEPWQLVDASGRRFYYECQRGQ